MPARPTCPFCGASVSAEARYCDRCGTPLTVKATHEAPPRQKQGSRRMAGWLFVLTLVLIFTTGTVGGYRYTAGHWPFSQPAVARRNMETDAPAVDPAVQEYLRSVVSVNVRGVAGNRAGSGFVIDTAGHVVTAAHVVEGAAGCITVFDDNGRAHQGTVVGRNPNLDVALIRVPTLTAWPESLQLGASKSLRPDEPLYALGSPKGSGTPVPLKARVGKVGGSRTIDGRYFASLIQFDGATIVEGASGGPLVQQSTGKVVGIVTAAAGNGSVAWAVPSDDVLSQIKQWAITPVATCSPGVATQSIPVVLAAITPQSGSYGVEGSDLADGVQLAIREMEPALQGAGYSVSLKTYDDQGSPERGREMASMAAYDPNVVGVVGSLESRVTFAVAEGLAQSGLVMVAPTASGDELINQGWPHFNRLVAGSRQLEQAAARYAQDKLQARAVYLIDEGTPEAKRQAASFQAAAQVISLPVSGYMTLHTGWDYALVKNALVDAKADAVYYAGGADNGFRLVQELRQDGFLIPVLGGESLFDPRFEHLIGPGARGIYFTRLTAKPAEPFQRRFETVLGKPTRGYAAYGYDAASVILTALVRYGEQNPARLPSRAELARLVRETRGYSGWSSWVTFGSNGENLSSWVYLFEWRQGTLEPRANLR